MHLLIFAKSKSVFNIKVAPSTALDSPNENTQKQGLTRLRGLQVTKNARGSAYAIKVCGNGRCVPCWHFIEAMTC